MLADSITDLDLICPRCRGPGEQGPVHFPLGLETVLARDGEFILEGFLVCSNPVCGRTYPILRGVPIVLRDSAAWWASQRSLVTEAVSSSMRDYLERHASGDDGPDAARNLLGIYGDAHFGMRAEPALHPPPGVDPDGLWRAVLEMLPPPGAAGSARALDLGCSMGRGTFELARRAGMAVGIDVRFSAVAAAAGFARAGAVRYERRVRGNRFIDVQADYRPGRNAVFLVADALDPPFRAGSFDAVVSLGLLDNVRVPLILLGQMDALLRPDGYLLLGSPYAWRDDITEPAEWLETAECDAPDLVRAILEGKAFAQAGFSYEILREQREVPWWLRDHCRQWFLFLTHLLLARHRGAPTS